MTVFSQKINDFFVVCKQLGKCDYFELSKKTFKKFQTEFSEC